MSRIQRLIERQGEDLARLHEREVQRFLRAFEDARRELLEELQRMELNGLDKATPYTAQHLRVMLAQSTAGLRRLHERLGHELDDIVDVQGKTALENLVNTIKTAEPEFKDAGNQVDFEVVRRLNEERGLLLHRYSLDRYGAQLVEAVQRELVTGMTRGQTVRDLTARIAGLKGSVLEGAKLRAELIVRMELNRAYNDAHLTSLRGAHDVLDDVGDADPLLKRADEYTDLRNHAISRVLHGQVVGIEELFHAPRARVEAEHQVIQAARKRKRLPVRRLSGIVWRLDGADYVGLNYPVHFWERGRITPWRRSWEETAPEAVPVEKPSADVPPKSEPPPPPPPPPPPHWTMPSKEPSPDAMPRGAPKKLRAGEENRRSDRRENESAIALARHGFDIEQLPERKNQKNPDYQIEGRFFDCYSPRTGYPLTVRRTFQEKIARKQAARFILNLDDASGLKIDDLIGNFRDDPLDGLLEILAVLDGKVHRIL